MFAWLTLAGCLEPPPELPEPVPTPVVKPPPVEAPEIALHAPAKQAVSPAAEPMDPGLQRTRDALMAIVVGHAGDPKNPWAIGHGLLAQGPDMVLSDGKLAVPWLFEEYAEWETVGGEDLVVFPQSRGDIRIEPHSDLMLKVLMEVGIPMDTAFKVQGRAATVEHLYRHSVWRAWTQNGQSGFGSMNDTPWALQAISTQAPASLEWTAKGNHSMSIDRFTDDVVADLHAQTAFMREAMAKGEKVQKKRQGIFAYTCGGQHLLQGAAYAVARGFGSETSRQHVIDEIDVLFWRMDIELEIYDTMIAQNPDYASLLLEQRLKFLGHFLESTHKLAALELFTPTDTQAATMKRARTELVATVDALSKSGVFNQLDQMKTEPKLYQQYLDFVGDSAHAVRAIDLATGAGTIAY